MNRKTIFRSVCLLLPAVMVGAACLFGLASHADEVMKADTILSVSQASDENSQDNAVSETAQPEEPEPVSSEQPLKPASSVASQAESQSSVVSKTESQQPVKTSTADSQVASSAVSEPSVVLPASSLPEESMESKTEASQVSVTAVSRPEETTEVRQEPSVAEVSREVVIQPSQEIQEQSKVQPTESTEESQEESSTVITPESSIVPEPEESEKPSTVSEEPTGKYLDGTYRSVAEVDGTEEEGFLYDLEVTVTVSGGEITAITGKIKNDRSDDPSANEAYVKRAVKKLSERIIDSQGTNGVDVISNATYSADAVLKATAEALAQAER